MRNTETTPSYPIEVMRQAEMDMATPEYYLSTRIKLMFSEAHGSDKAALVRIDRIQGSIYIDDSYTTEEEAVGIAKSLNQSLAPISDGDFVKEELIAVTVNGELLSGKGQRENVTNSR